MTLTMMTKTRIHSKKKTQPTHSPCPARPTPTRTQVPTRNTAKSAAPTPPSPPPSPRAATHPSTNHPQPHPTPRILMPTPTPKVWIILNTIATIPPTPVITWVVVTVTSRVMMTGRGWARLTVRLIWTKGVIVKGRIAIITGGSWWIKISVGTRGKCGVRIRWGCKIRLIWSSWFSIWIILWSDYKELIIEIEIEITKCN